MYYTVYHCLGFQRKLKFYIAPHPHIKQYEPSFGVEILDEPVVPSVVLIPQPPHDVVHSFFSVLLKPHNAKRKNESSFKMISTVVGIQGKKNVSINFPGRLMMMNESVVRVWAC